MSQRPLPAATGVYPSQVWATVNGMINDFLAMLPLLAAGVVQVRDRVLQAVAEALAKAGINLPFPTQQILFHDQTEATDGDRTRQREGWPAGDTPPAPRPLNRVELVGDTRAKGEQA